MVFEREDDARRVLAVLPKRMGNYGLRLHPEKTRLIPFRRPAFRGTPHRRDGNRPGTFDFLGFTHYWGRSAKGNWVVKHKTAASRVRRILRRIGVYCRKHRHAPLVQQHAVLSRMLRGHDSYYGITGNGRALSILRERTKRIWHKWLDRRRRKRHLTWERMNEILRTYPLPAPRIVHSYAGRSRSKPMA